MPRMTDDLFLAGKILRDQGGHPPLAWYVEMVKRRNIERGVDLKSLSVKTYNFYRMKLRDYARDLYESGNQDDFIDAMADLIQDQLTGAFRAGLREVDAKMTDELAAQLDEMILSEYMHVEELAASIIQARDAELGRDGINARLEMWAERWNDVKDRAILLGAPKDLALEWVYGDTEHCETCQNLNGTVAYAGAWNIADIKPQDPPNEALECGGWRCQCRLEPTDKKPNDDYIPGTTVPCNWTELPF